MDQYISKSGEVTVNGEDKTILVILNPKKYTVTFNTTPTECTVDVITTDGILSGPVVELKNGEYDYQVSKDGYETKTGKFTVLNDNITVDVTLEMSNNIIVHPTPSDAVVEVQINNAWVANTMFKVDPGVYNYRVSKAGYVTKTGTFTIATNRDKIETNITLEVQKYSLTINPTPSDATVEIEIDGSWVAGATAQVPDGDYNYRVTKQGYDTATGTATVNGDNVSKDVALTLTVYTLEITPTPSDAKVEFLIDGNWVVKNSVQVTMGTYTYKVSKVGYTTVSEDVVVNDNVTKSVTLEVSPMHDVTFNISPVIDGIKLYLSEDGTTWGDEHTNPTVKEVDGKRVSSFTIPCTQGTVHYKVVAPDYYDENIGQLEVTSATTKDIIMNMKDLQVTAMVNDIPKFSNQKMWDICAIEVSPTRRMVGVVDSDGNAGGRTIKLYDETSEGKFTKIHEVYTNSGVTHDKIAVVKLNNIVYFHTSYKLMKVTLDATPVVTQIHLPSRDEYGTKNGEIAVTKASDDTAYIAITDHYWDDYENVQIIKQVGDQLTPLTKLYKKGNSCTFSEDGKYLIIALTDSPFFAIYKRDGDTFSEVYVSSNVGPNTRDGYSCAMSEDNQYLIVGHNKISHDQASEPIFTLYSFKDEVLKKCCTLDGASGIQTAAGHSAVWYGQYLFICGVFGDTWSIKNRFVFKLNYETEQLERVSEITEKMLGWTSEIENFVRRIVDTPNKIIYTGDCYHDIPMLELSTKQ